MTPDHQRTVEDMLRRADAGENELERLRDHTLVRQLGEGGMGAVFLIRNTRSGDVLALKVMHPDWAPDLLARKLFKREVANMMALHHENVVKFRGANVSGNVFFLLMDYCEGGSVADRIDQAGGKLPLAEAMDITLQCLDGLDYAHHAPVPNVELADGGVGEGKGLVHRDLKPGNMFLAGPPTARVVRLGDYGLAKAFDLAGLSGMTRSGDRFGTPPFMPRHQVIDAKHSEPPVDVWAVAASLYNMLTGAFPRDFGSRDPWNLILETEPVPIRRRNPSIPAALADVIDGALDDTKDDLPFQSAAALKKALQGAWQRP